MSSVSSFDVFDTCLTRTFAYPTDLFLEVGEIALKKGWLAIVPTEFAARRIAAEREARDLVASREISLAQIYRQLGSNLGLSLEIVAEIQNFELQIEGQSLRPIIETRHRIAEARHQGREILFLSDMYLPASFLEEQLRRHEFYQDGDCLHVSGEVGLHKGDGSLFEHARGFVKGDVTDWMHFGDNPRSDVDAPRRLGFRAEHFEAGLLNRYELRICPTIRRRHKVKARILSVTRLDRVLKSSGPSQVREKWQSRLVAAMRLARLSKPGDLSHREKIIWDTGANLAGPLFYGYVKWVLDQTAKKNLSRLYFVARDGQILLKIAEIIQATRANLIDCRYLYGSRHAWLPASLIEVDETQLKWILAPTPALCLRDIFGRLEIDPLNHRGLLESSGFPESIWSQSLTPTQVERVAGVLKEAALSAEITTHAGAKREALLQYLRHEGVFEQNRVGIVDLGWHGNLKQALARVCELAPDPIKPEVLGFYFALVRSPQSGDQTFQGYVNSLEPDSLGKFLFYMQLLEAFAAADHGQTLGYQQGQPILARADNPALATWGLGSLQGAILAFCQAYSAIDDGTYNPEKYLRDTLSVMQLFYEDPTHAEIEAWGSFPFSDQQVETELETLLPSWNQSRTMRALLTKDGRKRLWWAPALAKREGMDSLQLYYRLQKLWRTRLKSPTK